MEQEAKRAKTEPTTAASATATSISEPSDAGAITVVKTSATATSFSAELRLKPELCLEACGEFKQWFCFSVTGLPCGAGTRAEFVILDAGESTFPDWSGYKVAATRDRVNWFRVADTRFDASDGMLRWTLNDNETPCILFAYFPTYSLERQEDLLYRAQATEGVRHIVLGKSSQGRDLHSLIFGSASPGSPKPVVWIQHRQHPGEVAASWFCEGAVERLLEMLADDDARSNGKSLLSLAEVHILPNLNPDGGYLGHLRTTATGANLNRCWGGSLHPDVVTCTPPGQSTPPAPETEAVIAAMKAAGGGHGPSVMLDVHQDEEKPYVFISKTPLGVPSCTPAMRALHDVSFKLHAPPFPLLASKKQHASALPWTVTIAALGFSLSAPHDFFSLSCTPQNAPFIYHLLTIGNIYYSLAGTGLSYSATGEKPRFRNTRPNSYRRLPGTSARPSESQHMQRCGGAPFRRLSRHDPGNALQGQ